MNAPAPGKKPLFLKLIFFLFVPLLVLFWMAPFLSPYVIGNDYGRPAINQQMLLQMAVKTGTFPLFIPAFAGGQTQAALTLGQFYHPISHLCAALPGYWNGKALEYNTLFRLLSLGLALYFLFRLLRAWKLAPALAFALGFAVVFNLKMLDLFRFGASLESWTGHIFLCAAIGFFWLRGKSVSGALAMVGATYWLVASGHPQMMYYGLLGAGLFTLLVPWFSEILLQRPSPGVKKVLVFYSWVLLLVAAGILLAAAYILPFKLEYMASNVERVGRDYTWAICISEAFPGTLGSFFAPLYSNAASGFGGNSLWLLAILTVTLPLFKVRPPWVVWLALFFCLLIFLVMQEQRLPFYFWWWKYMPMASSMRIAGRMSLMMPMLLLLPLAWLFSWAGRENKARPLAILAIGAAVLTALFVAAAQDWARASGGFTTPAIFRDIPGYVHYLVMGLGAASLICVALMASKKARFAASGLALFLVAQTMVTLYYGTWVIPKTENPMPTFNSLLALCKNDFPMGMPPFTKYNLLMLRDPVKKYYTDLPGSGLAEDVTMEMAEHSFLEPTLAKIYDECLFAESKEEAFALLARGRQPHQVVVEGLAGCGPEKSTGVPGPKNRLTLDFSSFNRLEFTTQGRGGVLGVNYPYSKQWTAAVNGEPADIYKINGGNLGIVVPPGKNSLSLRIKSPALEFGLVTSLGGLWLVLSLALYFQLNRRGAAAGSLVLFLLLSGFFLFVRHAFYAGNDLGISYVWQEPEKGESINLAYGKKCFQSSPVYANHIYIQAPGKAVDGDKTMASGAMTGRGQNPWWRIDLGRPREIRSMVVYAGLKSPAINLFPLRISFFQDQASEPAALLINESKTARIALRFDSPPKARFVQIQASGNCMLALDEVEIY